MSIKNPARKAFAGGFSLVELLLVLSLAPIVFFAVYSNFSAGVNLWQRLQVSTPEEDQVLFRLKTQRDFQNAMRFVQIPFTGDKEEVSFAAGIEADETLGGQRAIGRVHYFYDASAHALARETKDYSQTYRDAPGQTVVMAHDVASFELSYLVRDPLASDYIWQEDFKPEKPGELPLAVRFTVSTRGSSEPAEQTYFIPAGGSFR